MGCTPFTALGRNLLRGQLQLSVGRLTRHPAHRSLPPLSSTLFHFDSIHRRLQTTSTSPAQPAAAKAPNPPNLRKRLKDEAKLAKTQGIKKKPKSESQTVDGWELTVGIEIHAQLNSARKLFSPAVTSFNDEPNSHVAFFDAAMPGSQPLFQKETLIPAIRAALALNCTIQPVSRFDRKHYFWWDQPSGYQITQYYEPFAKGGFMTLTQRDGIAKEDGEDVTVRIKQVQLEQDTAKTLAQVDGSSWLDLNRVGLPLIEVITEPDIRHPRTAAAFVRKIQLLLNTVDSCVSGMEAGGLRADVNVSVRRTDDASERLGTRTEIKNLSTIKAVEDAIIAERDRQIRVLEGGGAVAGETRGWSIGATETRRLRGKEGEVDYRYMPDPDLAPLIIGNDLVEHLRDTLAVLPDQELDNLVSAHGLTPKDALSLIALDNGVRIQYFYRVVGMLAERFDAEPDEETPELKSFATLAGNWIIHELGRLTTNRAGPLASGELTFTPDGECEAVPATDLSLILYYLYRRRITGKVAKELLDAKYRGDVSGGLGEVIEENKLWFDEISAKEYVDLAASAIQGEEKVLREFVDYKIFPQGKLMYLVGKMMRLGPTERIDPTMAGEIMRAQIEGLHSAS